MEKFYNKLIIALGNILEYTRIVLISLLPIALIVACIVFLIVGLYLAPIAGLTCALCLLGSMLSMTVLLSHPFSQI